MPEYSNYVQSVVIGGCDAVLMGQTFRVRGEYEVKEKHIENLAEKLKRKKSGKTKR